MTMRCKSCEKVCPSFDDQIEIRQWLADHVTNCGSPMYEELLISVDTDFDDLFILDDRMSLTMRQAINESLPLLSEITSLLETTDSFQIEQNIKDRVVELADISHRFLSNAIDMEARHGWTESKKLRPRQTETRMDGDEREEPADVQ
jgi:hypothetical protein